MYGVIWNLLRTGLQVWQMPLKIRYVSEGIYTDKVKGLLNVLVRRVEKVNYDIFGDGI